MDTYFKDRFKNTVVVVTGAAQGIGKGVAERIYHEGGFVALVDRSEWVHDVVKDLNDGHGKALAVIADLETHQGFENALKEVKKEYGKIDVLINNVGGTIWAKPFTEYKPAEIEKEINRSLYPTLWGCRCVLPYMLTQKKGTIINISSIATKGIHRIPYSTAKGAVNSLTASLAMEYAEKNIRVNAIATGGTEAPPRKIPRNNQKMTQKETKWYKEIVAQTVASSLMKRYGTIQEQVNAITFLASEEASYITGITLPVSGGDLG